MIQACTKFFDHLKLFIMNNPFEHSNTQADKKAADEFYAILGRAVTAWQWAEMGLFMVFDRAIGSNTSGKVVSAAFFSIVNFKARLDMTNAAMLALLEDHEVMLRDWIKLYEKIGAKSTIRNKLTHYDVFFHVTSNDAHSLFLAPNAFHFHQTRKHYSKEPNRFDINYIAQAEDSFVKLAKEIIAFVQELERFLEQRHN